MGTSTTQFGNRPSRTPARTPVNMSEASTGEDREFAEEIRGPNPNRGGFRSVCKPMILQLENGWKSQKSMRGLPHGDGVHKNEAGIQQGIMLAPRLSGVQRVSPWVASAKGASVTT
jgi:hypothetical protein